MVSKVIIKDSLSRARIMRELKLTKGAYVNVGVLGPAARERPVDSDLTLAEIATVNEFGTKDGHIPARPFMRNAWDKNQDGIQAVQRKALEKVVSGKMTAVQALGIIGEWFKATVQKSIVDTRDPPNAPRTIAQKGSSHPLIDTGRMRQSVTYEVHTSGRGGTAGVQVEEVSTP